MTLMTSAKEEAPNIKVAIVWPTGGSPKHGFTYDYGQMMAQTAFYAAGRHDIDFCAAVQASSYLHQNRNGLVLGHLRDDAITHFLFLDDDMRFPKDVLLRLLERGKEIVGANYSGRWCPPRPLAVKKITDEVNGDSELLYTYEHSHGCEEVETMGLGVTLIARHVFDTVVFPWFECVYNKELLRHEGEDTTFFSRARAAGYKVYVDHDLSKLVGHDGDMTYTMDDAVQSEEHYNGSGELHGAASDDS